MLSRIKWGAGSSNTITFEHSLGDPLTDRPPREGSEWAVSPGGTRDAWIVGKDYTVECTARLLRNTTVTWTGVSGTKGWQDFLDYARAQNPFTFIANTASTTIAIPNCFLVEPLKGFGEIDSLKRRSVKLTIINATYCFNRAFQGALYTGP